MDIFGKQEQARRRTGLFLRFFVLGVGGTILATYGFVALGAALFEQWHSTFIDEKPVSLDAVLFRPKIFLFSVASVVLLVGSGMLNRWNAVKQGGAKLAEHFDGVRVIGPQRNPRLKQLQNIVEEMAIAAGIPVPAIYVLPYEKGINSFAAGLSAEDAAVAVTHGAVQALARDELSAIIAHEIGHIVNGDFILNTQLLVLLAGVDIIWYAGYVPLDMAHSEDDPHVIMTEIAKDRLDDAKALLTYMADGDFAESYLDETISSVVATAAMSNARHAYNSQYRQTIGVDSIRSREDVGGAWIIFFIPFGFLLLILGWIGMVSARLLQRAICREREYYADARAAQFTRYPAALASAFLQISKRGSRVRSRLARQAGHLFVAPVDGDTGLGLLSTHPPLADRIQHLGVSPEDLKARFDQRQKKLDPGAERLSVEAFAGSDTSHVLIGAALLASLPPATVDGARKVDGATGVVLGLILSPNPDIRRAQATSIEKALGTPLSIGEIPRTPRSMALFDIAAGTLTVMDRDQYEMLRGTILACFTLSDEIDLPGFSLASSLIDRLDRVVLGELPVPVRHRKRDDVLDSARHILGALARFGGAEQLAAADSFVEGMMAFGASADRDLPDEPCTYHTFRHALLELGAADLAIREAFLEASVLTIQGDGAITGMESAILRGIASALHLALPPVLSERPSRGDQLVPPHP